MIIRAGNGPISGLSPIGLFYDHIGVVKMESDLNSIACVSDGLYLDSSTVVNQQNTLFQNNAISITVNQNLLGTTTLAIDTISGCVGFTLGMEEYSNSLFTVFPNPATTELNINTNDNTKFVSLAISDILGQEVLTTSIQNNIPINQLRPGIYFITASSATGTSHRAKFIKQ
jgi:Secretion system C-terminal sorting domain